MIVVKNFDWRDWAGLSFFCLALGFSLLTFFVGWQNPILEAHGFRQTQTALTAYYLMQGGPFFAYETPILGAPWSIPFEFPLYQWLVAVFAKLSGQGLDPSGRIVARIFHYFSLVPVWWIGLRLGFPRYARFFLLGFFVASPILLFWSRTFMIESTALFFALAYGALLTEVPLAPEWTWRRRCLLLLALATCGIFAATVKITTFLSFFVVGAALLNATIVKRSRAASGNFIFAVQREKLRFAPEIVAAFVLPILALIIWTSFADQLKLANPLAHFISSDALKNWNFGTWAQRTDFSFWNMLFRKQLTGGLGHRTPWLITLALLPFVSARARWIWLGSFLLFLFPPLVFTNLHIVHEYYAYASVPFLVFGFTAVAADFLGPVIRADGAVLGRFRPIIGCLLIGLAAVLLVREYLGKPLHVQAINDQEVVDFAHKLRDASPADSILYVYGFDWHPMLVYYSERRGLMNRDSFALGSLELEASLNNLSDKRIGAALFCGAASLNQELIRATALRLGLGPDVRLNGVGCVGILP